MLTALELGRLPSAVESGTRKLQNPRRPAVPILQAVQLKVQPNWFYKEPMTACLKNSPRQ